MIDSHRPSQLWINHKSCVSPTVYYYSLPFYYRTALYQLTAKPLVTNLLHNPTTNFLQYYSFPASYSIAYYQSTSTALLLLTLYSTADYQLNTVLIFKVLLQCHSANWKQIHSLPLYCSYTPYQFTTKPLFTNLQCLQCTLHLESPLGSQTSSVLTSHRTHISKRQADR